MQQREVIPVIGASHGNGFGRLLCCLGPFCVVLAQ